MSRKLIALFASSPDLLALAAARPLALPADAVGDLPKEIVWMPAGMHEITCFAGDGKPWEGTVLCDEAGARLIAASFAAILAAGQRVYLDKDHKDEEATAWVTGFRWDPAQGIMARVEWTSLGQELLRGKVYYSFSPAFMIHPETKRVTRLIAGHAAGGLVNAPAFGAAMPALIAARLAGAEITNPASGGPRNINQNPVMKELLIKILAALAVSAPADATEEQLVALATKHVDKLPGAGAEGVALKAQLAELQSLKAKEAELETLKAKDAQRRKDDAKSIVDAAVARGALPPKDEAIQAKWRGLIESDPSHAQLLAALPGATVLNRVTQPGGMIEVHDGAVEILKAYKAKCGATRAHAQECAAIYAKDIRKLLADPNFQLLPLLAANSLGSLAGNLILQRSLTLLKLRFPALFAITTDFSDNPISFGQTVMTRLRTVPTVQEYDPNNGGYAAESGATTIDVPIVINKHKYVPISFNANELAETKRDLFGEQVEGAFYAIAKDFWDAILALVTVGHFSNETVIAAASMSRDTLQTVDEAFLTRGVPAAGRFAMLNGSAFHALGKDIGIVMLAAFQAEFKGVLTDNALPPIAGFQPYQVGNIPAGENLIGLCGTPDCLAVAARLPNDYTQAMGDVPATAIIEQVTNPDTNFSMMLVKYLDHRAGSANWRAAYMRGQAVGQAASLQRLVSVATSS